MLTDKFIKSVKSSRKSREFPDGLGLSLRVAPAGGRSFQYRYRNWKNLGSINHSPGQWKYPGLWHSTVCKQLPQNDPDFLQL